MASRSRHAVSVSFGARLARVPPRRVQYCFSHSGLFFKPISADFSLEGVPKRTLLNRLKKTLDFSIE